mmetsp:Transcript_14403/g.39361  ORF Transcript_14403/g.39361 Transcript_14403/m.39361 type:complete len:206 (+) Transcript_14403:88-705(+)
MTRSTAPPTLISDTTFARRWAGPRCRRVGVTSRHHCPRRMAGLYLEPTASSAFPVNSCAQNTAMLRRTSSSVHICVRVQPSREKVPADDIDAIERHVLKTDLSPGPRSLSPGPVFRLSRRHQEFLPPDPELHEHCIEKTSSLSAFLFLYTPNWQVDPGILAVARRGLTDVFSPTTRRLDRICNLAESVHEMNPFADSMYANVINT